MAFDEPTLILSQISIDLIYIGMKVKFPSFCFPILYGTIVGINKKLDQITIDWDNMLITTPRKYSYGTEVFIGKCKKLKKLKG